MCQCDRVNNIELPCTYIAHHCTFIDKLLPGSFQTTAEISRVGHAHPDFFQGGHLPTLLPPVPAPMPSLNPRVLMRLERGYWPTCLVLMLLPDTKA